MSDTKFAPDRLVDHSDGIWIPPLQTFVKRVGYDYERREGFFDLPECCCTHMPAAIEFFERIDPGVQAIYCLAGDTPDIVYRKADGTWTAFLLEPK